MWPDDGHGNGQAVGVEPRLGEGVGAEVDINAKARNRATSPETTPGPDQTTLLLGTFVRYWSAERLKLVGVPLPQSAEVIVAIGVIEAWAVSVEVVGGHRPGNCCENRVPWRVIGIQSGGKPNATGGWYWANVPERARCEVNQSACQWEWAQERPGTKGATYGRDRPTCHLYGSKYLP